jgi:hypothetical protein
MGSSSAGEGSPETGVFNIFPDRWHPLHGDEPTPKLRRVRRRLGSDVIGKQRTGSSGRNAGRRRGASQRLATRLGLPKDFRRCSEGVPKEFPCNFEGFLIVARSLPRSRAASVALRISAKPRLGWRRRARRGAGRWRRCA